MTAQLDPSSAEAKESPAPSLTRLLEPAGIARPWQISLITNGRTSRVWKLTPRTGPGLYVKLTDPHSGTPLFPNVPAQEWQAMLRLSAMGLSPVPVHREDLPNGGAIIVGQEMVSKEVLTPSSLASLLWRIHSAVPWPGLPKLTADPEALLSQGRRMLGREGAPLWLAQLAPKSLVTAPAARVLIHRDLVPANVAPIGNGKAVALDWQCPALGSPLEDLAHATSPAMQSLSGGHPQLEIEEVLAAYPNASVRQQFAQHEPFYRWRMACYCLWQVRRGQDQYRHALGLECDALEKAYQRVNQSG